MGRKPDYEARMTASMYRTITQAQADRGLGHWPPRMETPEGNRPAMETRRRSTWLSLMTPQQRQALPEGTMGQRIMKARAIRGLSLESVSGQIDVALSSISLWERDVFIPREKRMEDLAAVLHVSVSWIRTGHD